MERHFIRTFLCSITSTFVFCLSALPAIGAELNLSGMMYFFTSQSGIMRFDAKTRNMNPLGISGSGLTISPDGSLLAYTANNGMLHVYDLGAGSEQVYGKDRYRDGGVSFISNDELACVRSVRGIDGIYATPAGRTEWDQFPYSIPKHFLHDTLAVMPDANHGTPSFVVGGRGALYLIAPGATKPIFVSPAGEANLLRYPAVSPDGKKVAFSSDIDGIWVVGIDGSNSRKLINSKSTFIAWSPDGRYIAYSDVSNVTRGNEYKDPYSGKSRRGAGAFAHHIWVMRSDGSDAQPLHTSDGKPVSVMYNLVWR